MPRSEKLRQHLPCLYRPDSRSPSLINGLLDAVGSSMDAAQGQLTQVLQSHWFRYADKASYDEHAQRDRERRGLSPYNVLDPDDALEILRYPYIEDLARHGKLVAIPPWLEPANQRDLVENYRRRLAKIIALYRHGLGTVDALRGMVEAELPWALENPLASRLRSFSVEEGLSFEPLIQPVIASGPPTDTLGALMRWHIDRGAARTTLPTLIIEGVAPLPGEFDPTDEPMVERYNANSPGLIGLGVAYTGVLAAGEALRLQPSRRSWMTDTDGLRQSPLMNDGNRDRDPSANGPWQGSAGSPNIAFSCLLETADGCLWLAGAQQLWRFDGDNFEQILAGEVFTDIHCLFELDRRLFIGCDDGLFFTTLYPADGTYNRGSEALLAGVSVYQIAQHDGLLWLATAGGPISASRQPDQSLLIDPPLFNLPCYSLLIQQARQYFGCDAGLLRFDMADNRWHAYRGETDSEPQQQWLPIDVSALPDAADLGLPPVRQLAISPDQSLWLGSDRGLARWYARHERDFLYRATLEAYPDLSDSAINQLQVDDRGMLWICSERGLFRYDGRDLAQYQFDSGNWLQLGRADSLYPNELAPESRGQWRFSHSSGNWEQFDTSTKRWHSREPEPRSTMQPPVWQVAVTGSLQAHLGNWNGSEFSVASEVPANHLRMRCKPDPMTTLDGGPARIPTLPGGLSTWRYLQLDAHTSEPPPGVDLPWWSREGRLFPPPQMDDVYPGRYRDQESFADGRFDESVFAYQPSARITQLYTNPRALGVCVRLFRRNDEDTIDPAFVERVQRGIDRVRPAGVPVKLAVEGKLIGSGS